MQFAEQIQSDLGRPVAPRKYISLPLHPNQWLFPGGLVSTKGRIAIVTNARRDAVDAAASARKVIAGQALACERTAIVQDERRCCVRQNRVVPTPVAGAKLSGGEVNSTELDQP